MEKIIFHIDVNNAFLSWTAIDLLNNGYKYEVYLDASKRRNYKHKYEGIKLYKNDKYVLSEPRLD